MDHIIKKYLVAYFATNYGKTIESIEIRPTRPQFKGDLTVVVFQMLKLVPKKPADLAAELGIPVSIEHNNDDENGRLIFSYSNLEELDRVIGIIMKKNI